MSTKRRNLRQRIIYSPVYIWMVCIVVTLLMRLIYLTCRVTKLYPAEVLPYTRGEKPAIFCFWHGRMLAQPFINPSRPMHVLISRHRDGIMISTLMRCFGIHTISGSKSKGAAKAMFSMIGLAEAGANISITPDGPRGPHQIAAEGAAFLASKTGYPILCFTYSASRVKRLRSWDRFMIFKPFARIQFIAAQPIHVPKDADEQTVTRITATVQEELNRITREADLACGVAP